ncbi:MAG: crossover junction endodeoxyribonuclease RuvC [Candidatus Cloacimonetes bacterium]|nr:crossover junction endodeoxyribonuclease RuvC [Candidatus Cloacimonadota bacterium]MDD4148130.1 crossover junction endodeoxyribonuclease RuvC [Candidatus Cloacimonadota bacterium]MDD4560724.1 crossover junction endodeoxyribonuclease RuvC [Candidatus Cloacimonadota bacterium]
MIVGIDPGSRYCGYGLIQTEGIKVVAAGCQVIDVTRENSLGDRLKLLHSSIVAVLEEYKPDYAAVESMFFQKHIKSIFTLGHARGVVLLALAQQNIPIVEYSPREVKKAVVGNGNATKAQIRYMIHQLYSLKESDNRDDAYDALAIATTHFNRIKWNKK